MALIKEWEDFAGQTGNYWRMVQVNIYRAQDAVEVTLYCYKDKATREAGKQPMAKQVNATIPLAGNDITLDELMAQSYAWLKKNKHADQGSDKEPYFKDAVDG
jgi:hypothetical protein